MAFDLASISSETCLKAPRILVLGVEKIGKTTFAADSNEPIFCPIKSEKGADNVLLPKFKSGQTVPQFPACNTMDDLRSCFSTLWEETHSYQTIVIDSASALQPLVFEEVCKDHGVKHIDKVLKGYNKGQNIALNTWQSITDTLDLFREERNISSIIIGHVRIKRFDDPIAGSYDSYEFDLDKHAAAHFYRWADAILFCNTKTAVTKEDVGYKKEIGRADDIAGDQRFLYTKNRPAHPGGGRGPFGQLPYELPMPKDNPFGAWMAAVAQVS
ncbi:hypothetical protein LCGC14_0809580 [marine sediment metagenome]|uniref:Uncharacterized protein n=1 Tax=marine sediment metagenome TaxID=412755 RepID=A0A0F9SUQ6_9ZZZZ|nr:ATP-binding protein [Candidatus Aminicenantes bacterium]